MEYFLKLVEDGVDDAGVAVHDALTGEWTDFGGTDDFGYYPSFDAARAAVVAAGHCVIDL